MHLQVCQVSNYDPTTTFDIADPNTEEMWIDTDGTPYVYYTGPEGRLILVIFANITVLLLSTVVCLIPLEITLS